MNKLFLMLCMSFCFFFSCTKMDRDIEEKLQGEWILESTSGSIAGNGLDTVKWDEVVITGSQFKLLLSENNEIIAEGEILPGWNSTDESYNFNFEKNTDQDIELQSDPNKFVEFTGQKMDWLAPCCDRINYHLVKK